MKRVIMRGALALAVGILGGCATYSEGNRVALEKMSAGDYRAAAAEFEKNLKPEGDDRLLYHLELGLVRHQDGQFEASNRHLDMAAQIAEDLYTKSIAAGAAAALTNPRNAPYAGAEFEKVLLHYYKALNYWQLAAANPAQRVDHLEKARIEARRVDILLTEISKKKGDYRELEDKKSKTFTKLLDIFSKVFQGNVVDKDWVVYREDAFVRYLTGVMYEQNREWDDARIAYRKAAETLEQGYAKQYGLGEDFTAQAWFDTLRMMRSAGFSADEVGQLAKKKLSAERRRALDDYKPGSAQIVVITQVGMIPRRGEMSLHLTQNANSREWILKPVITGTPREQIAKWNWFYAMYADKGLLGFISKVQAAVEGQRIGGFNEKTVKLPGPVWKLAEDLKVVQAIGGIGVRVTIPYFDSAELAPRFGATEVTVDGRTETAIDAQSAAQLAVQELLLNAGSELNEAMGRELLKNVLTEQVASQGGQYAQLFSLVGKVTAAATSAAETRGWISLPHTFRIQRFAVEPGDHEVSVRTSGIHSASGQVQRRVSVKAGEIAILHERQMSALPPAK